MTVMRARTIVGKQTDNLRKVNGKRFVRNGYEYKVVYDGGISCYVALYRRQVGKRNFQYYTGFGAYECWNAEEVMSKMERVLTERGL